MASHGLPSPDGGLLVLSTGQTERTDRGPSGWGVHDVESGGGARGELGGLGEKSEVVGQRSVQFIVV